MHLFPRLTVNERTPMAVSTRELRNISAEMARVWMRCVALISTPNFENSLLSGRVAAVRRPVEINPPGPSSI